MTRRSLGRSVSAWDEIGVLLELREIIEEGSAQNICSEPGLGIDVSGESVRLEDIDCDDA